MDVSKSSITAAAGSRHSLVQKAAKAAAKGSGEQGALSFTGPPNPSYVDYTLIVQTVGYQAECFNTCVGHMKIVKELVKVYMRFVPREKGWVDRRYSTHLWNMRNVQVKKVKTDDPIYWEGKQFFSTLHRMRVHPFISMQRAFRTSHARLRRLTTRDEYITAELSAAPKPPVIKWEAAHIGITSRAIARIHEFRMYLDRCAWVCRCTDLFDQVNGAVFKDELITAQEKLSSSYKGLIKHYQEVQKLCKKAYFPEFAKSERESETKQDGHVDTSVNREEVTV